MLCREALVTKPLALEKTNALLLDAIAGLEAALGENEVGAGRVSPHDRQRLLVERAAIYGFLACQRAKGGASSEDVWRTYEIARAATSLVSGFTSDYRPKEMWLLATSDLLQKGHLPETYRLELRAEIESTMESIDVATLPADQRIKYDELKVRIAQTHEFADISDSAFSELAVAHSKAGYVIRARQIGGDLAELLLAPLETRMEQSAAVAGFFWQNWLQVNKDSRCLRYQLKCDWLLATETLPFNGERLPLPRESEDQVRLLDIVHRINELEGGRDNLFLYLEAVLLWVTGRYSEATEQFQNLGRASEEIDTRRLIRGHVICNAKGPVRFSGRIEAPHDEKHYNVRVDSIDRTVALRPGDFPELELSDGRHVDKFAIAFDFMGPIADPIL